VPDLTRRGNLWAAAQQLGLRRTSKKSLGQFEEEEEEEEEAVESAVIPNRRDLRRKGMRAPSVGVKVRWPSNQFGRLIRYRLAPCSLDTHVTLIIPRPNGKPRRVEVPRTSVEGIRHEPIFKRGV
jgi:hypothetical protein